MKKIIFTLLTLTLLLGACSPAEETPPPLTSEDVEATAISMAWTMAAQTQEAMPTSTQPPTATFTPIFTETPIFTATPLFTATPIFTATPVSTATKEGEIKMLTSWDGPSTRLLIVNDTKATASVSLYLSEGSNERGYWGNLIVPVLGKKQSVLIEAPMQGYYSVFAYMDRDGRQWSVSGGLGTNNPDKHEIHLTESGTKIVGP